MNRAAKSRRTKGVSHTGEAIFDVFVERDFEWVNVTGEEVVKYGIEFDVGTAKFLGDLVYLVRIKILVESKVQCLLVIDNSGAIDAENARWESEVPDVFEVSGPSEPVSDSVKCGCEVIHLE